MHVVQRQFQVGFTSWLESSMLFNSHRFAMLVHLCSSLVQELAGRLVFHCSEAGRVFGAPHAAGRTPMSSQRHGWLTMQWRWRAYKRLLKIRELGKADQAGQEQH